MSDLSNIGWNITVGLLQMDVRCHIMRHRWPICKGMADDPRVPPYVIDAVMDDPTAKRLIYLSGMTERDMRTDLSGLAYVAITAFTAFAPREPMLDQRRESRRT